MKILMSIGLVSCLAPNMAVAKQAFYMPKQEIIEWYKVTADPGIYKIYGNFGSGYSPMFVPKQDLSFSATKPVDGIFFGWNLVWNKETNKHEHCFVDHLFENGLSFMFCDKMANGNQTRKVYKLMTNQLVGQVENIGDCKKGSYARMKVQFEDYEKDQLVKVKALFTNKKVLILKSTLETTIMTGPYLDAISKLVDIDDLEF